MKIKVMLLSFVFLGIVNTNTVQGSVEGETVEIKEEPSLLENPDSSSDVTGEIRTFFEAELLTLPEFGRDILFDLLDILAPLLDEKLISALKNKHQEELCTAVNRCKHFAQVVVLARNKGIIMPLYSKQVYDADFMCCILSKGHSRQYGIQAYVNQNLNSIQCHGLTIAEIVEKYKKVDADLGFMVTTRCFLLKHKEAFNNDSWQFFDTNEKLLNAEARKGIFKNKKQKHNLNPEIEIILAQPVKKSC